MLISPLALICFVSAANAGDNERKRLAGESGILPDESDASDRG